MTITKPKSLFFLLLGIGLLNSLAVFPQYYISGVTLSKTTRLPIDSVCVVLEENYVPIDTTYSYMSKVYGRDMAVFNFEDLDLKKAVYSLRFIHPNFQETEIVLDLSKYRSKNISLDFTELTPKPKDITLGGATVRATRIKMLYKGDTVVYDADAFQLAKGSMLEALIDELPGVQLKDDGEIFVNGRKVDELLLNGKDFFRGNQLVLLENLPSYMVNNIKVYEREDRYSRITQKKNLALDVVLKKQYRQGWLANAEAAYGTKDHYLARLFGMRFTDFSRISAFANLNNINDNRKPGRRGDWQSQGATSGRIRTLKGGLDLLLEDRYNVWRLNSSNEIISTHQRLTQQQTHTSFLPQGNSYSKGLFSQRNNSTLISSRNTFDLKLWKPKNKLRAPVTTYLKWDMSYRSVNTSSFRSEIEHSYDPDSIDISFNDIRKNNIQASRWYNMLLHTNQNIFSQHLYAFSSKAVLLTSIKPSNALNETVIQLSYDYNSQSTTSYTKRDIHYPSNPAQSPQFYHRYTRTPLTDYTLKGQLSYSLITKYVFWLPSVKYQHSYSSSDHSLFNLSDLVGWGIDNDRALRSLPSTRDSLQMCFDAANSYYSATYEDKYTFGIEPQHSNIKLNNHLALIYDIGLPVEIIHTRLHYQRNTLDATKRRTKALFNPSGWAYLKVKNQEEYGFSFGKNTTLPSLLYRLDITDTSDPLNTTLSNPHLKNTTSYSLGLSFRRWDMPHYGSFSTRLSYSLVRHALAMGFLYDTSTGIRTTRPDNVNGNWNLNGKTDFSRSFLKDDPLSLETHTSYGYLHSVDLTGTTQIERSIVHNVYVNEELSLKYKIGRNNIGLKGKLDWTNLSSPRAGFQTQNLWDFHYGLTALWNLPWALQLSTDLTMFCHRGYDAASMNRNDLVWNARLIRTFFNGKLTCFIDGFDILGNLSNIQRYVNAQGHTETRYNVVPRYAMLHLVYRFAKQPKRK